MSPKSSRNIHRHILHDRADKTVLINMDPETTHFLNTAASYYNKLHARLRS